MNKYMIRRYMLLIMIRFSSSLPVHKILDSVSFNSPFTGIVGRNYIIAYKKGVAQNFYSPCNSQLLLSVELLSNYLDDKI